MCLICSLCLQEAHWGSGAQCSEDWGFPLPMETCMLNFLSTVSFNSFSPCVHGWALGVLHPSEEEIVQGDHSLIDSALHLQAWQRGLYAILFTSTFRFSWWHNLKHTTWLVFALWASEKVPHIPLFRIHLVSSYLSKWAAIFSTSNFYQLLLSASKTKSCCASKQGQHKKVPNSH